MSDELKPTSPLCSQCGMYHPKLEDGQECPMKHKNTDTDESKPDIGNFLVTMRTILLNNIEKKKINDIDKFKNQIIVQLNKIIENYKE